VAAGWAKSSRAPVDVSGVTMGWGAGWAKPSRAPSAAADELHAKNVHVGEPFNRFADVGL